MEEPLPVPPTRTMAKRTDRVPPAPVRRAASLALGLLLAAAMPGPELQAAEPAAGTGREYEIKAAFLYKFTMFVEWPSAAFANPGAPVLVGILGADPFGDALGTVLRGRTVRQRPLQFRTFAQAADAVKAGCHVLFVARSEIPRLPEILEAVGARPVLTVGDTEGCAAAGVAINLVERDRRVRFEINREAAARAGLRISSQLLDLAVSPVRAPAPGGARP